MKEGTMIRSLSSLSLGFYCVIRAAKITYVPSFCQNFKNFFFAAIHCYLETICCEKLTPILQVHHKRKIGSWGHFVFVFFFSIFAIFTFPIVHLVYPPKCCIKSLSSISDLVGPVYMEVGDPR